MEVERRWNCGRHSKHSLALAHTQTQRARSHTTRSLAHDALSRSRARARGSPKASWQERMTLLLRRIWGQQRAGSIAEQKWQDAAACRFMRKGRANWGWRGSAALLRARFGRGCVGLVGRGLEAAGVAHLGTRRGGEEVLVGLVEQNAEHVVEIREGEERAGGEDAEHAAGRRVAAPSAWARHERRASAGLRCPRRDTGSS